MNWGKSYFAADSKYEGCAIELGYQIEIKNKKWSIIDTVTDGIVAEFDTEKDIKIFLANESIYEGKKKAIEILMSFPNQWRINGERQTTESGIEDYTKWLLSITHYDTYADYYKAIDAKLNELLIDESEGN